jgi:hypothetical protein
MGVRAGAPPSTRIDIEKRKGLFNSICDRSIKAQQTCRADPGFAETSLQ